MKTAVRSLNTICHHVRVRSTPPGYLGQDKFRGREALGAPGCLHFALVPIESVNDESPASELIDV